MAYLMTTLLYLFALERYVEGLLSLALGAAMGWGTWLELIIAAAYWLTGPFFCYEETEGFFTEERFPIKWRAVAFGAAFLVALAARFII